MKGNIHTANFFKTILKPRKKTLFVMSTLYNIAQSCLAQFLIVSLICSRLAVTRGWWYTLLIAAVFFGFCWRRLAFEFFLIVHHVEHQIGIFPWYTVIDDNVILGAMPMQDQDIETFKKLHINAVVSVVQPWELTSTTMFGVPISSDQWKRVGIKHYILSSPDFIPPGFDVLDEGARLIDQHVANNERVYVHCKSGVGRSASVVLAYFLKFKGEDVVALHKSLKGRRPVIFSDKSSQMKNMIHYEQQRNRSTNRF